MLRRWVSISIVAVMFAVAGYMMMPTQTAAAPKGKNDRGQKLYMTYCASCHGENAKGSGPAATALKTAPADLTNIPKENGKFPALKVKRIIGGDDFVTGHGSREMPIWGDIFRAKQGRTTATANVYALTVYLESIQK